MRDFLFEIVWTAFWLLWAFIGLAASWPWWVVVILFALAGFIYVDGDIF